MSKCVDCGREMLEEEGEEYCGWCEDLHEEIVKPFREMPKEKLELLAASMSPLPRMVWWPEETMTGAQVREFVCSQVQREKKHRISIDGCIVIEEEWNL